MLIVRGPEVLDALEGQEAEIVRRVADAYRAHADARTSVPHSVFLRFPREPRSRIIALPAYLDDGKEVAGVKWVSSFPDNAHRGLDRASSVIVLNSCRDGRPETILEGSIISARRTAASAALAASVLQPDPVGGSAGLVGCGPVNFEIARFLLATRPGLGRLTLFDIDAEHSDGFRVRCRAAWPDLEVEVAGDADRVLFGHPLVSIATTATHFHLTDLSGCEPGAVVLHVSLRDIAPEAIVRCDNVTDDIEHVLREGTSLAAAEQQVGHRRFLRCTLGDILAGRAPARTGTDGVVVFSPFGLGILDLAVAALVRDQAVARGLGMTADGFFPPPMSAPRATPSQPVAG